MSLVKTPPSGSVWDAAKNQYVDPSGNPYPASAFGAGGGLFKSTTTKAPASWGNFLWSEPPQSAAEKQNNMVLPPVTAPFVPTPVTTAPPYSGQLNPAIQGLVTPGLVPDIARQSAEVSAGRGVGGSPAGGSTAVRMSEQNWLQRLGLANTLIGGEAGRQLPYDITPSQGQAFDIQQRELALRRYMAELEAQTQQDISRRNSNRLSSPGSVGGGGGKQPYYPFANLGGSKPGPYDDGWGSGTLNWGAGGLSGGGGLTGSYSPASTLDDAYEWLGFGDFGSQAGDESLDTDFYEQMWD